ncbi:unnamed protein product [Protopolystoma xenopodis]|uniref:Uncharacterized protein n=1 Tax=Protopolystoma xenopodis TaxID=117903 RepID=A0A3S5B2Z4_9PLAT|nr:unnamed protein product [Protopolystoma xenopodis]
MDQETRIQAWQLLQAICTASLDLHSSPLSTESNPLADITFSSGIQLSGSVPTVSRSPYAYFTSHAFDMALANRLIRLTSPDIPMSAGGLNDMGFDMIMGTGADADSLQPCCIDGGWILVLST